MKLLIQNNFLLPPFARRAVRVLTGIVLLWQATGYAYGQAPSSCSAPTGCNMLTNPSFEQTINGACPTGVVSDTNPLITCNWHSGNELATPDYFNACASGPVTVASTGVPCNFAASCNTSGQSQPALTGQGYTGLIAFLNNPNLPVPPANGYNYYDYREYIAQKVTSMLQAGTVYYAAFQANIAPGSTIAIPRLGMAFTTLPPVSSTSKAAYAGTGPIPLTPAISGTVATTPQAGWNLIQGMFTATGNETQAIIGNFGPGFGPAPTYTPPFTTGPGVGLTSPDEAYYFIEDAVLQAMPTAGSPRQVACGQNVSLGTCALPVTSGATYNWSPTTDLVNPTSATPTLAASGNSASLYTLSVILPNGQKYTTSTTITLTAPTPTITPSAQGPYCAGSTITLTAAGGGPGAGYTWSSPSIPGFSATGASIVVTPSGAGTFTYAVSTSCGGLTASASYNINVQANCCLLTEYQNQGRTIHTVVGNYYSQNPFNQGPNAVYHIINNGVGGGFVNLTGNSVYTIAPGSILLFDSDCGLTVQTGAELQFSGVRFTAACDKMWAGIYASGLAGGIRTFDPANPNSPRNTIEHCSSDAISVSDDPNYTLAPYFQIANTDFRQNYCSVFVAYSNIPATANDWVRDCTFDSDPASYRLDRAYPGNGYAGWYSDGHAVIQGDVRAGVWRNNTFNHAMTGLKAAVDYSWYSLENNTFRNCFMAGIGQVPSSIAASIPHAPAGQTEAYLYHNHFYLPSFQPTAGQQYSAMGETAQGNDASTQCHGVLMCSGRVDAFYNTFQQDDPLTGLTYDDYLNVYPQSQVGMAVYDLHSIENNTFTRLQTGIIVNPLNGTQGSITGNVFDDCAIGIHATTLAKLVYASPNAPVTTWVSPTLFTSCNTFRRDGSRNGFASGILLTDAAEAPVVGSPLLFDDLNNPGAGLPLKDLFEPQGRGPGDFASIDNHSSYAVDYHTFSGQVNAYQALAGGAVNFIDAGPIDLSATRSNPNPWQPCYLDGYGQSGLQMRPSGKGTAVASTDDSAHLEQNVPNPCSDNTLISYTLPKGTKQAGLIIRRGLDGVLVEELPLKTITTEQQLDLHHYAPGLYFYTLTADGVPVQTKRMLVK